MSQKKILLLGGSAQQVIAIKTAKELGYYTVLCDYLSDNPGQYVADKYYNASTTDVEAVYQIAKDEQVNRKSTRLNSSHQCGSRMPSSA